MFKNKRGKPSFKIWIEYAGKPVVGKGGAAILEQINNEKSISKAAKKLNMSYRYVWNYLKRIERIFGEPVIETHRGGEHGGGGATLTKLGENLLNEYKRLEHHFNRVLSEME